MKILDYKQAVALDDRNQTEQAVLLCYFHNKCTDEQMFDMKGIQELFSDAGYSQINSSRVKKNLLEKKQMRIPKGMKTSLEFVPAVYQELDQKYASLWEDTDTITSDSELIDENKFGGKRQYLTQLIRQINHSYAHNCYDAAAVLMRRLFEVLLVLSYQNMGIDNEIKDPSGKGYVMLESIVGNAKNNQMLKLSRIKNEFDSFRMVGNFSAHNITYTAGKKDIDDIKLNKIDSHQLEKIEVKHIKREEPKVIKEALDVTQGKLIIGLDVPEEDKFALSMYNVILGGGANSKLFQNVREKASLAYTASSSYLRRKNVIIIRSGIELQNYDKALTIIKQQIEDMAKGKITDDEIEAGRELLIALLREIPESQEDTISFYYDQNLYGENYTIKGYIEKIESINKAQIVEVAKQVSINTIYFLENQTLGQS